MKTSIRLFAAFAVIIALASCGSTASQKKEVHIAKAPTNSDDNDLNELIEMLKKGGIAAVAMSSEEKTTKLPSTGYSGVFVMDTTRMGDTSVGGYFDTPEHVLLGKPAPDDEKDIYIISGNFVEKMSYVYLRRADKKDGNKVFCFSEKTDVLARAQIMKNTLFIIEDTDDLTSDGERMVKVIPMG